MLRKIGDKKDIIMVLFGMVFLMLIINMTDVTKTSALFVEEQEPVLVYNETLNKIETGKFELVEDSLQKKDDKIVFQVRLGRSIVSDSVPEDYLLDFDKNKCSVKIKRNGKNYSNITYPEGSTDYAENILTFECANDETIEEVSFKIKVDEVINGIRFYNTRGELNVVYVNEMLPPVDYNTLIEKMHEYLKENPNRSDITVDIVKAYVASKGVNDGNYTNDELKERIPGIVIDNTNSVEFTEALRDDFEKYMFREEYNATFPDTVEYINKALNNPNSPLFERFVTDSEFREVGYFVYYGDNDGVSVIQIDKFNTIRIFDIEDVNHIDEALLLYIPASDSDYTEDILKDLSAWFYELEGTREENDDGSITVYLFLKDNDEPGVNDPVGDDVNVSGPTDDVVNNKETKYREFLNQLNGEFNNTETFIRGLELNEENPFYQYFTHDDVNTLYYVYYERNNEELEELSEKIDINYLTLIEMNKEKIQVSKLDSTNLIEILKADNKINIYTENDESSFISSVLKGLLEEIKFASTDYVVNIDENMITFTILNDYKEVSDGSDLSDADEENGNSTEDDKGDVDGATDEIDGDSLDSDGNDESDASDEGISSEDSVIDGNLDASDARVNNSDDASSIENSASLNDGGSSLDFSNTDNGNLLVIS